MRRRSPTRPDRAFRPAPGPAPPLEPRIAPASWFNMLPQANIQVIDSAGHSYAVEGGDGLTAAMRAIKGRGLTVATLAVKSHGSPTAVPLVDGSLTDTLELSENRIYVNGENQTALWRAVVTPKTNVSVLGCDTYEFGRELSRLLPDVRVTSSSWYLVAGIPGTGIVVGPTQTFVNNNPVPPPPPPVVIPPGY